MKDEQLAAIYKDRKRKLELSQDKEMVIYVQIK